MEITWYGHSCFLLESSDGVRILTDPCAPATGYELHDIAADAVTCSHAHYDHNYVEAVSGTPVIIADAGEHSVKGIRIVGIPSYHDEACGQKRGANMIYIFDIDDMRIMHCGDIGHTINDELAAKIGHIDVLLVPIGGNYTVDYRQALDISNVLKPRVVIPMHYKTPDCMVDICDVAPFIVTAKDCRIHRLNQPEATLTRESLGEDRVLVLDYKNCSRTNSI